MISLAGGLPNPDLFPVHQLAEIAADALRRDGRQLLQYGLTGGQPETKDVLREHFGLGDQQLVITTGSQQGLDLLARILLNPGDQVVTSDSEYLGTLQALSAHGAVAVGFPVHKDGLDVAALEDRLAAGFRPKVAYVVPHFHNPTGATLSPERRKQLHALSSRYGFVVIEDDPYRELFYDSNPPTEVDADADWTIRLRSTSKTLAPGLRIGVVSGPRRILDAVTIAKQSCDLHTSSLNQAIIAAAVQAPWFDEHLDLLRSNYGKKRSAMLGALSAAFGDEVKVAKPAGGMFVWADFGSNVDTADWLKDALGAGVCFVPGSAFEVGRDLSGYMRLSFSTATVDGITEGVARLAKSARLG